MLSPSGPLVSASTAKIAELAVVWLSRRLRDPAAYFVCEGVEGGIATGATWPVPPCFLDRTTAGAAAAGTAAAGADPATPEPNALRGAPAADACAQELAAAWLGYGVASVLLLLGAASCLHGCLPRGCCDVRCARSRDAQRDRVQYSPF